jgi:hypothetical protein
MGPGPGCALHPGLGPGLWVLPGTARPGPIQGYMLLTVCAEVSTYADCVYIYMLTPPPGIDFLGFYVTAKLHPVHIYTFTLTTTGI